MTWTKTLPTNNGYYWWRKNKYKSESIYYVWISLEESVGKDENVLLCRWAHQGLYDKEYVTKVGGEWLGPLKPPGD